MDPLLLYIDCAIQQCSVAIAQGKQVLSSAAADRPNAAAEVLNVLVEEAVQEAGISFSDLQGVCISGGPGSYTGLRITASAAKGFCFALDIPLLQVSTLEMMVYGAMDRYGKTGYDIYVPMIDARRMEVFCAEYSLSEGGIVQTGTAGPLIVTENRFDHLADKGSVLFFGNGAGKCQPMIGQENFSFWEDYVPAATDLVKKGCELWQAGIFEDVAYFEPKYLKEYQFK